MLMNQEWFLYRYENTAEANLGPLFVREDALPL